MILHERLPGLRGVHIRIVATALLLLTVQARDGHAQIPPPEPAPMAASIGFSYGIPLANLAMADWDYGRYATAGTAMTQRFSYAPLKNWGVFFQASFPAFGVDTDAVARYWEENSGMPVAITDGGNNITAWNLGLRWRQGRSWMQGAYAEAMVGAYRDQLEMEVEGSKSDTTFTWETGWGVAAGYVFRIAPAFAVDTGVTLHEFKEDFFINRWMGFRFLAVLTFGGNR